MTTVVIIEDNPEQLFLYKTIVEMVHGVRTETYETGTEGLERVMRDPAPDIFMLDMHLPGVSGDQIFKVIRERIPQAYITVVTADDQLGNLFVGVADKVFIKPNVPVTEVLEMVEIAMLKNNLPAGLTSTPAYQQ